MASKLSIRAVSAACAVPKSSPRPLFTLIHRRTVSTATEIDPVDSVQETSKQPPRWSYTPPQTKAPFSLRLHSTRPPFKTNSNTEVLDKFYVRMLGPGGDKVLSEELKWLAITHKSFDQGRRGFNDRLAFLGMANSGMSRGTVGKAWWFLTDLPGKRIVTLQASLALVQNPQMVQTPTNTDADQYGRKPFSHPALDKLKNLSAQTTSLLTDRSKLAELANKYELQAVLRWAPVKVCTSTPVRLSCSFWHILWPCGLL